VSYGEVIGDKSTMYIRVTVLSHFFQYSSGFMLYHCIYGCLFCILLFNFVNYVFLLFCIFIIMLRVLLLASVFLLLYMFRSVYSVSLCCSVCCLCVNVYCATATGCQPKFS
jgi:hypothetical protein